MTEDTQRGGQVGADLYVEVLQFLYREAALLDDGAYDEWLTMLHQDFTYDMPVTLTRDRSEQQRVYDDEMRFFSENVASLQMRVDRLHTEYAWAEDPPTRTRHLVSNVMVRYDDQAELLTVASAFAVHANRGNQTGYDLFVGSREDLLGRRADGDLELRRRTLWLDQAVVGSNSISIFL